MKSLKEIIANLPPEWFKCQKEHEKFENETAEWLKPIIDNYSDFRKLADWFYEKFENDTTIPFSPESIYFLIFYCDHLKIKLLNMECKTIEYEKRIAGINRAKDTLQPKALFKRITTMDNDTLLEFAKMINVEIMHRQAGKDQKLKRSATKITGRPCSGSETVTAMPTPACNGDGQ